ncbi:hypothetical protein KNE206_10950 [Kitasatospora sp. NE20-6]|uniref:hypothetical protein n=1 Tax=Kitasatospora sp. NE20-6 TaxID=2859066 RepID=UPI0034DBA366
MTTAPTLDVPGVTRHRSAATGLDWEAVDSLYYDCHVVSLTQLLPPRLLAAFLLVAGAPALKAEWGGLSCRNLLDSEVARDALLLGEWGVEKHHLPVHGDIEATLRAAVREHGHCIARVDSYYHEHFPEYHLLQHRTNGHKVTVVDFDEESYTGIDNVGVRSLVLRFDRALFTESIRSNLVHVYDKYDSLYRLKVGPDTELALADGTVAVRERAAVTALLADRAGLDTELDRYGAGFAADLTGPPIRRHAQLDNTYHTALMVERAYLALAQAHLRTTGPWAGLPGGGAPFLAGLDRAAKGWRMLKMLCRNALDGGTATDTALLAAFGRMRAAESAATAAAG